MTGKAERNSISLFEVSITLDGLINGINDVVNADMGWFMPYNYQLSTWKPAAEELHSTMIQDQGLIVRQLEQGSKVNIVDDPTIQIGGNEKVKSHLTPLMFWLFPQ